MSSQYELGDAPHKYLSFHHQWASSQMKGVLMDLLNTLDKQKRASPVLHWAAL